MPERDNHAATLAQCQQHFATVGAHIFYDISTMLEQQWTGIPIVAAGLAGALLRWMPHGASFFLGTNLVRTAAVADALRHGSGLYLERDIKAGHALGPKLPVFTAPGPMIGLFPSVKPQRRSFDIEASLFHDLSTLVLPNFHIQGNVEHHMAAMLGDIASNDLTIAVSAASRDDLIAYLGVPPQRLVVAHNGVTWPPHYPITAANDADPALTEPFVLILGTREPRKNVTLVFDMLERFPELLQTHRFVFAGKMGWLEEQHALPKSLEPAVASKRILFTGFVTDYQKYLLLSTAQATLYPSLFEGFGLPVLESLSAGTPCVASYSSSLPEVGGDVCHYFDPLNAADLHRALEECIARRARDGASLARACRDHAAQFTWDAALASILDPLRGIARAHARHTEPPKAGQRPRKPASPRSPTTADADPA